jgi:hypothetical protein
MGCTKNVPHKNNAGDRVTRTKNVQVTTRDPKAKIDDRFPGSFGKMQHY